MKGMETAIRGALERAGTPDISQREQIYASARHALQRSLEKQGVSNQALISAQLGKLDQLIAAIEADQATGSAAIPPEHNAAIPPVAPARRETAAPLRRGAPANANTGARVEPSFGRAPKTRDFEAPPGDVSPVNGEAVRPDPSEPAKAPFWKRNKKVRVPEPKAPKKRRPVFATLFSFAVILSFFGIGFWFLLETGALKSLQERDTSVPNPPASVNEDDFTGTFNPNQGFSGEWTTIYTAASGGGLQLGPGVSAETVDGALGRALRIQSSDGGPAGEASVMLSPEALALMAGRKSILALSLRSAGPEATQIYVECDFATLGACGRKRFDVTYEVSDFLMTLDFERALAPATPGRLIINSDISGKGTAIDLLAVRIRPAN